MTSQAALGAVSQLWRYPASSLAGEPLDAVSVGTATVDGDRLFGLVDASGEIARPDREARWHQAPRIRSRLTAGRRLEVAVPGGDWLPAPAAESDRAVSEFLGFEASIRPYFREHAPDYSGPLTQERYTRAPLHLLTTASLARLKALHPQGTPDPRRFRPNIVVDMDAVEGSFPETEWIGRKLAVGDLLLTVSEPCRRCGFTIIAQDGFDTDPGILRNLVRHNTHNLGVYCTVDRPARVEIGAPMRFV
ncbi:MULTISPECIES: MOSC domain-containing protein [unclassified Mesorhizobium]|uniref:MOSC domain-containing protein n=1 Tax=unclassified Mesorhizobium TaxID=325217 RepID=UPI000BAFE13F|nr:MULTISPECIES: MOSC domain-containing protein [unclassified Mesorhizobium]TGT57053.1 MOSC domain-containing protein [Mesorhizobium sp. M00.F.Ca.ET.170.01.1.1]AZO10766.1 MOSC domain-containing protein [Mesorhizobium sp. M3A.F.Ca.ET.080.04.2.1]PBB88706.1 MOSC domain-containing protein [Mesorhizobium sp. WSM3876]RWB70625.1 MAG: MOSC domain-containing protein [Mesorhizobium sp.]RWB92476.1 MAG: MOSC domain-containing protein [Mesorhizobium sp.]